MSSHVGWQLLFVKGCEGPSDVHTHTHTHVFISVLDMIAIIGTSDRPCWLAEACKISSSSSSSSMQSFLHPIPPCNLLFDCTLHQCTIDTTLDHAHSHVSIAKVHLAGMGLDMSIGFCEGTRAHL